MNIKNIILAMLCIVGFNIGYAQEVANSSSGGGSGAVAVAISPIVAVTSPEALRNYALSIVRNGSVWYHSESVDWTYTNNIFGTNIDNVMNVSAEGFLDQLARFKFNYRVLNTNDPNSGWLYLYDQNYNNTIFYGKTEFPFGGRPKFNVWMQDVPLLTGVKSSEILALNEDGETVSHQYLYVRNGQVMFRPWMAGAPNGIWVVRMLDGSTWSMMLSNPVPQQASVANGVGGLWNVEGHYISSGGPVKIIELYNRPTVMVDIPTGTNITFDVVGVFQDCENAGCAIAQERPTALIIDWPNDITSRIPMNNGPSGVNFPTGGKYRCRFEWNKFGKPNMIYVGPIGGKG